VKRVRAQMGGTRTNERGTSLVEVLIATMVLAAVMATVLSLVDSSWRRERSEEAVADTDASVGLALDRFGADVRHARALVAPLTGQNPAQVLTLDVTEPDGQQGRVRWRTTASTVVRERLDLLGGVSSTETLLVKALPVAPTFAYFGADGSELQPGVVTPSELATCTAGVRVHLQADPSGGRRAVTRQLTLALPAVGRGEVAPC
jgi:type II secretory pathway pseudopilin PulG